jgi:hypothetical protein
LPACSLSARLLSVGPPALCRPACSLSARLLSVGPPALCRVLPLTDRELVGQSQVDFHLGPSVSVSIFPPCLSAYRSCHEPLCLLLGCCDGAERAGKSSPTRGSALVRAWARERPSSARHSHCARPRGSPLLLTWSRRRAWGIGALLPSADDLVGEPRKPQGQQSPAPQERTEDYADHIPQN